MNTFFSPGGAQQEAESGDVWVEPVGTVATECAPFYGIWVAHGAGGFAAEARARFNLSAYVRHEIAKAMGK